MVRHLLCNNYFVHFEDVRGIILLGFYPFQSSSLHILYQQFLYCYLQLIWKVGYMYLYLQSFQLLGYIHQKLQWFFFPQFFGIKVIISVTLFDIFDCGSLQLSSIIYCWSGSLFNNFWISFITVTLLSLSFLVYS